MRNPSGRDYPPAPYPLALVRNWFRLFKRVVFVSLMRRETEESSNADALLRSSKSVSFVFHGTIDTTSNSSGAIYNPRLGLEA